MWIRSAYPDADKFAIDEVYLSDEYQADSLLDQVGSNPVIVDIGAHIGSFTKRMHERIPGAVLASVECCPENIDALRKNVGEFAEVFPAACTYDSRHLGLFNTVIPDGVTLNSQMSRVFAVEEVESALSDVYFLHWIDRREVQKVTIGQILSALKRPRIDILKLDCEGSEYSILSSPEAKLANFIVGEWHDTAKWWGFLSGLADDWMVRMLKPHDHLSGWFQLQNADFAC